MNYRSFGRTGWNVSEISFGAWAIGGSWGDVSEDDALDALRAAIDEGVNFIDTADVYGDGRSERLISQVLKEQSEDIDEKEKANNYSKVIAPFLDQIRYHIDKLELIVDDEIWPLPKYRELLFTS